MTSLELRSGAGDSEPNDQHAFDNEQQSPGGTRNGIQHFNVDTTPISTASSFSALQNSVHLGSQNAFSQSEHALYQNSLPPQTQLKSQSARSNLGVQGSRLSTAYTPAAPQLHTQPLSSHFQYNGVKYNSQQQQQQQQWQEHQLPQQEHQLPQQQQPQQQHMQQSFPADGARNDVSGSYYGQLSQRDVLIGRDDYSTTASSISLADRMSAGGQLQGAAFGDSFQLPQRQSSRQLPTVDMAFDNQNLPQADNLMSVPAGFITNAPNYAKQSSMQPMPNGHMRSSIAGSNQGQSSNMSGAYNPFGSNGIGASSLDGSTCYGNDGYSAAAAFAGNFSHHDSQAGMQLNPNPGALLHSQASGVVAHSISNSTGWQPTQQQQQQQHLSGGNAEHMEALLAEAHKAYRLADFTRALQLCAVIFPALVNRTDALLLAGAVYYQLGNYEKCIAFNDRCILIDPHMAEAHANLANALQQIGNFDLALIYYQSALTLKPDFTDAYNNMASALVQKGCIPQAMDCYAAALRINPNVVDVHNNMGDLWRAQGAPGRVHAQRSYAEALRRCPTHSPAWRGLGDLYRECGDNSQAVACYQEAIRLRSGYTDAYTGMGVSLKALHKYNEAAVCFQAVVHLRPSCALSLGNLAGLYYEMGKLQEAVATYREAIAREPNFPEAYNNLGNALRESGRMNEAIDCYTACIQLQIQRPSSNTASAATRPNMSNPGAAPAAHAQRLSVAYNNLGGILKMQGRTAEAISCYEQVSLLQPTSPEGHANLASAFKDAARQESAISSYRKALTLRPDFPDAFANLVHSLQCVCEWKDRAGLFVRLEMEVRRDLAAGRLPPVQPFHIMAYPFPADLAKAVSVKYAEYCALTAHRLNAPPLQHPPPHALQPGQPLRVGYVSSDFGNHPLSHLMSSVFGLHDRSRVEVFCYAISPSDNSEWRIRIEAEVEHFLDVSAWSIPDIAARIASDRIQVAVNLNGYTKGARNEIFALKPAPVQTSYMGFPATTGAEFVPYLITDKVVAPPEYHSCYSESLALMPHCYFVNDYKQAHKDVLDESQLPTRAAVGLPEGAIIYACSNQLYKYDPETFNTWCNILRRVPNSVLWLLRFPPYGEPHVKAEATQRGIDPNRIIFTDVAPKPIHIARSGIADVFLDTPLCNAHTTGCDVLWGGCPMVTLPLERMASRVAASLCAATGLGSEMIVSSQKEYEELAVSLGTDHHRRLDLRRRLKERRLTCPLFDTTGWVRDLERVYFKMWEIHCAGQLPHTFQLEPIESHNQQDINRKKIDFKPSRRPTTNG